MAWFSRKKDDSPTTRTLSQLTPDEREALHAALFDGATVAEVVREYNLSSAVPVYQLRRNLLGNSDGTPTAARGRPSVNPDVAAIKADIEKLKAEAELERVKEELEYQRELRRLTLEEKRLEIEARRAELEGDDEDDDAIDDVFEGKPEMALFKFFIQLMSKGSGAPSGFTEGVAAPVAPPPTVQAKLPTTTKAIDWTKDQPDDEIEFQIMCFDKSQIMQAKMIPEGVIRSELQKRFPGITENNINKVLEQLRHYGE